MSRLSYIISYLLIFLFSSSYSMDSEYGMELNLSALNSSHYDSPVSFRSFEEGGYVDKHSSKLSMGYYITLLKRLDSFNTLRVGFGYNELNHGEKGFSSYGDQQLHPYNDDISYQFLSLSLGHRYRLISFGDDFIHMENSIISDLIVSEGDQLNDINWSYKFRGGYCFKISELLSLNFGASYKTAISEYNSQKLNRSYYPYSFGAEIGVVHYF